MSDDLGVILLVVVLMIAVAVALRGLFLGVYHGLIRLRWVTPAEPELFYRRAAFTRIAAAREAELVRIRGRVRSLAALQPEQPPPVIAPFTATPCCYCATTLEHYRHDPESDRAYDPRFTDIRRAESWYIEDESGTARVNLPKARSRLDVRLDPARDQILEGVPMDQIEAFLADNRWSFAAVDEGFPWGSRTLPADFRLRQRMICTGDELLICGRCYHRPGSGAHVAASGHYRAAPTEVVIEAPENKERTPLLVTNDKKLLHTLGRKGPS